MSNFPFTLPQRIPPRLLYQGAANAVVCDTMSLKNVIKAWIVVIETGANDTDLVLTVKEATDVAAATNKTATNVCAIWADIDAGTGSDTLVRQTDATGFTIDPATMNGAMVVFEIDPARFDNDGGYDCVYLGDSGGHASNTVTILGFCLMKDDMATALSVIVD